MFHATAAADGGCSGSAGTGLEPPSPPPQTDAGVTERVVDAGSDPVDASVGPLRVMLSAPTHGVIESFPVRLLCGAGEALCDAEFPELQGLLVAAPLPGYRFVRWQGDCYPGGQDASGNGRFYLPERSGLFHCGAQFEPVLDPPPEVVATTSFVEGEPLDPMSSFSISMRPPELRYVWSTGTLGDEAPLNVEGPLLEGFIVSGALRYRVRAFDGETLVAERDFVVGALGSSEPPLLLEQDAFLLQPETSLELRAKALDLTRPELGYVDIHDIYTLTETAWFIVRAEVSGHPLASTVFSVDPQDPTSSSTLSHSFAEPGLYWIHMRGRLAAGGYVLGSASVEVR